jgi:hypothetical protein
MDTKKFYECHCHSSDHVLWFEGAIEPTSPQFDVMMVGVQLAPLLPWYKRLWVAVKYVFNPHGNYSHWHETMLPPEEVERLNTQLHEFLMAHWSNVDPPDEVDFSVPDLDNLTTEWKQPEWIKK